jgi:hypothetical protein
MFSAKVLGYYWIDGKDNPADIVSKHWGYQKVWKMLRPSSFYSEDTPELIENDE